MPNFVCSSLNRSPRVGWIALFVLALIYIAAWLLQGQLFLNGDVSYYSQAAKRLLEGGSYTKDFFNANPPLILYLYRPPLLANQFLGLNVIWSFRLYFFLLASLSLALCFMLLRKIFAKDSLLPLVLIVTLSFLFLIVPAYHLGQRDYLLVIFAMPYLFLLVVRLQGNGQTLPIFPLGLLLGFMAALGFALKPQFLIIPCLVELYGMFYQRNVFAWLRTETLTIMGFLIAYLAILFIYYPDFIFLITPYILRNYYASVGDSWPDLLLNTATLFFFATLLLTLLQLKRNPHKELSAVLLLAFVGYILSDLTQRTTFYYHAIPALTVAVLLLVLNLSLLAVKPRGKVNTLLGVLLLLAFLPLVYQGYSNGFEYKEKVLDKLLAFMQTQAPHRSLYVFSRWGSYGFPVLDYSDSILTQRFDCLWPVAGFLKQKKAEDENFFMEMIAEDFQVHKPDLVFVDRKDHSLLELDPAFDYVDYFSQNQHFRQQWKSYHYLTTLDEYPLYRLEVYQRNAP